MRRVFRHALTGIASLVVMLCLAGIVDYVWIVARSVRFVFAAVLILGAVALLMYAFVLLLWRPGLPEMARDIERAAGRSENSLVTYAETQEHTNGIEARPYVLERLEAQARRELEWIDVRLASPHKDVARSLVVLLFVLVLLLALRVFAPVALAREARRILWLEPDRNSSSKQSSTFAGNSVSIASAIESLQVRIVPPAYTGLGVVEAVGDGPLRVLAGSQIQVNMTASGKLLGATLGFGGTTNSMRALGGERYSSSFQVNASGVFEVRVISNDDHGPAPVVRAVEVYADEAPEANITEPRSDQLLRGLPVRPVPIRWTASDDLGLSDVVLKYIRSRGEGDAAQFVNGNLSFSAIEHMNAREWRGTAEIDLARLGLQQGDTLVYWIEARDHNPFANNTGRSSSLAIAIAAPEPVKLNLGDLGPTEIGKFLLSERMIIIHTEKLHSDRGRYSREELLRRAGEIAAEQRDFKNSFNNYMHLEGAGEERHDTNSVDPGSVEGRVREAEDERTGVHMHGIPDAPPGSTSSVRDMVFAIRAMWNAEDALSLGDTANALVYEREALTRLKQAQLAVRYVPPVFARSKPIDLKRRYAGELKEIKTRLERLSRPSESKETSSLRASLTDSYAALAELQATLGSPVTARANAVARARERARNAADRLAGVGGDHAATIAEALGQLRIVETELSHLEIGGNANEYATRVSKSLSLLTQAAGNLFVIAEARTHASWGEANNMFPADQRRASEYFRRLNK